MCMQTYEKLYDILSSKPHDSFYLDRYIRFILNCIDKNSIVENNIYTEKHHIAPKSKDMFPQFKSFKENPWNLSVLTFRQHIICHILLYKVYKTESQLLSILRTSGQPNVKRFNLKGINTRLLEMTKIKLSDSRKNKPRNLSEEAKLNMSKKLSKIKTEFYSNPENRKKQSEYCKGTSGRISQKYHIVAKNRSEEHKRKLKTSIKTFYDNKRNNGESLLKINGGLYVTPIGVVTNAHDYCKYCKTPDKKFNIHHIKKNPKLNNSVIGKTPRELGFFFIEKTNPLIEQYYVLMNQVHQPEPNHPLLSELNDYLLPKFPHHLRTIGINH